VAGLTRRDLIPVAVLGLILVALVIVDLLRDLPRRHQLAVRDDADFRVQVQDEPDEGSFKIEDEPEERTGKLVPVKVDIKDEPGESGPAAIPIDPTPRVKYALRTPPGSPQPPPELRDFRQGPNAHSMPNKGVPNPVNPFSFGMSATAAAEGAANKMLTWAADGHSNCTVVRFDGILMEFGTGGRTVRAASTVLAEGVEPTPGAVSPSQTTWVIGGDGNGDGGMRFHQVLEVVPGQTTGTGKSARRLLDTVLVRWVIENRDGLPHKVALRLNMDTLIGNNDGVPFTVPGRPGLVNTCADFPLPRDVPDFVQALEVADLHAPGTIAHLTLKVGSKIEPPDRLSLTFQQFWGLGFDPVRNWSYPIENMRNDSAVVLYWSDKDIPPGAKRTIGFAYGLGQIASEDKLGITLGGSFDPGQAFTVTAYVEKPQPGQTLRLKLPEGLSLVAGAQTQAVPPAAAGGTSLVTWKVRVERTGTFRLVVNSSTGLQQARTLTIAQPATGKLALDLKGSFTPGQTFRVTAKVTDPVPGQTLTLQLPAGLQRTEGDAVQSVPAGAGKEASVQWQVRVLNAGKFPVRVASSTGVAQTKTLTIAQPGGAAANFTIALKGEFAPGQVFTVAAQVTKPDPGQTLTLQLPAGLERVEGEERQAVPPGAMSNLSWKVKIVQPGTFPVRVASSTGITQRKTLLIEPPGDQPGRFTFEFSGTIRPGKEFTVTAKVPAPVPGQTLTLVLPKELELAGSEARQAVPASSGGPASVVWRVRVVASGRLPVRVDSSTGLRRTKTITLTQNTDSSLFGR
jgi:predicted secreted protein